MTDKKKQGEMEEMEEDEDMGGTGTTGTKRGTTTGGMTDEDTEMTEEEDMPSGMEEEEEK